VQDIGRFGFQQFGVPVSGALDKFSLRVANLLVGNPQESAVIEMTFAGMKLEALAETDAALTGAQMPVEVNGRKTSPWSSFTVKRGDIVTIKPAVSGLRGYLAVTGGFDVPLVMNSRATYVGGKIGGFHGRPLGPEDILHRGKASPIGRVKCIPEKIQPVFSRESTLRAIPGPQNDFFEEGKIVFFSSGFKVSSKADRMGYRLEGNVIPIKSGMPGSIISEPSLPGAVQIPADGQPIILLVEQTVGGYAKIATVISVDVDIIAQARPGDTIRFQEIDLASAHKAAMNHRSLLEEIRNALR
ncbi:MAG TPA: biotin-dependent carboxyltransferase, partial [Desulfobacteraceae bacterium]|nr:biotin-dependent carboxyltransferase [Desulfobacteraceae bacterium]